MTLQDDLRFPGPGTGGEIPGLRGAQVEAAGGLERSQAAAIPGGTEGRSVVIETEKGATHKRTSERTEIQVSSARGSGQLYQEIRFPLYNQGIDNHLMTTIPEGIFRAYDIRGKFPAELNEEVAASIAKAFAVYLRPWSVILGRDVRKSGDKLFPAVKKALLQSGVNVIDVGIVPADLFYYAVGSEDADGGIFISASHNPADWNGMNMSRREAEPISSETGLKDIHALAAAGASLKSGKPGRAVRKNVVAGYFDFVKAVAPIDKLRPMTLFLNGNFGVSAKLFRKFVERYKLPFKLIGLNDEPDGSFPKGAPDPLLKENRIELSRLVLKKKADLGIAWDADGDRVFFVDEAGRFLEGYFVTALLARETLRKKPGSVVITDPRLIWATQEVGRELGGRVVVSRAGMTIIAERMKKESAQFAGEMSGHFYFRETFNRDNGFLPVFLILSMMGREGKKLSAFLDPLLKKHPNSGEINFPLEDRKAVEEVLRRMEEAYAEGKIERIDGLSVEFPTWRFNLRASNTEPLLRLNVEARNKKILLAELNKLRKLLAEPGRIKETAGRSVAQSGR